MSEQPPIETIARWFYEWERDTEKLGDISAVTKYRERASAILGPEFEEAVKNLRLRAAFIEEPADLDLAEVVACEKWFADAEMAYIAERPEPTETKDTALDYPKSRHLECLEKHLAYAEVLESESRSGYPANRRLVIGNLVAAEEHAKEDGEAAFAETLRQSRRAYQNEGTTPDFQGLFDLLRSVYAKV